MATGDIRIDALLALPQDSLTLNHTPGTAVTITYNFNGYTAAQAASVTSMLKEISSVAGISFKQVAQGGLLTYNWYTDSPALADGSTSTGYMKLGVTDAGVYLNVTSESMSHLEDGYGRQVALHETLHALGLKHPGLYSQWDTGPYLPAELATANHTVMAYNGGNSDHLGDFDALVLQYLYGGAGGQPSANIIAVTSPNTTGSYFNDQFILDVTALNTSVRVSGGEGIDQLNLSIASSSVKIQGPAFTQLVYTKPDGSFSGIFLDGVERIQFTDKSVAIDNNAAQAYRLYEAAFNRKPDLGGLGYWIKELDKGVSLDAVAQSFITSTEFKGLYGATHTNDTFITALYQNILDRAPDQGGFNYWSNQLQTGALNEAQVLASFSESNENKIALSGVIQNGVEYLPG